MNELLLAIFVPLGVAAAITAWVFWAWFTLPAARDGSLSVREHKLPIAISFIVLGLAGETVLYGYARWSSEYVAVSNIMPLVLACKACYLIGLNFAVAWAIRARTGISRLWQVFAASLTLWALSFTAIAVWGSRT